MNGVVQSVVKLKTNMPPSHEFRTHYTSVVTMRHNIPDPHDFREFYDEFRERPFYYDRGRSR